jgi:hypothetical protein
MARSRNLRLCAPCSTILDSIPATAIDDDSLFPHHVTLASIQAVADDCYIYTRLWRSTTLKGNRLEYIEFNGYYLYNKPGGPTVAFSGNLESGFEILPTSGEF